MDEKNEWDDNAVGPGCRVSIEQVVQTLEGIRSEQVPGAPNASLEMIADNGEVGIPLMVELCRS